MDRGTELLLDCLKNEKEEAQLEKLQDLSAGQWEEILVSAARSRMAPLLYHTLKPQLADLPQAEGIREKLRQAYYTSAARNMRLYRQLLDIVTLFSEEGVPVVLLKGSHLAELVYGNLALRPMSDMDLLVKPGDLQRANRLLKGEGYSSSELHQGNSFEHLAPYRRKGAVSIEIHHQITEPPFSRRFNIEDLWKRARRETIEGVNVLTLAPEDLILHLSAHVSIHHGFSFGIIPYIDIARAVDYYSNELDWKLLWQRAETWGMQRSLYLVLALADKMVGLSIPGFITGKMADDPETKNALVAAEGIIFGRERGSYKFFARVFGPEPFTVKLKIIRKRLFPAGEFIFTPAAENSSPVNPLVRIRAYLLRIKGLYQRHGKAAWSALRRDPATVEAIQNENRRNDLRRWMGQE